MEQNRRKGKGMVRTVCGDLPAEKLGYCDCHCHPLVKSSHLLKFDKSMFDVRDYDIAISELGFFKEAGGKALVDAQPIGCGRASAELPQLSRDSGLHIIAGTGFHMQAFYPAGHWTFSADEKELTRIYIEEIERGMYVETEEEYPVKQITARAGYLKNATETPDFDEVDRRRLRAVANASLETGAPLLCHTNGSALTHIPYLLELGVKPESIIVAHLDKWDAPADDYHLRIADLGVFLEFDGIVEPKYSRKRELDLIKEVLSHGYGDRLMIGSDPTRPTFKAYGGPGLDYLPLQFAGMALEAGITVEQLIDMAVTVPAAAFSLKK